MYYPGENLMDFGLWEFKHADWRIRPVYYGYGLISRFAPPGARPLLTEVEPDFAQVSAATVETPAGRTLFAVNLSENAVTCEIDGLEGGPYAVYEYAEERLPEPGEPGYGELETLRTGDAWSPGEALTLRPETLTALRELP
jgi:hypothetical protein